MKKISIIYWSGTGNTEAMAGVLKEAVSNGNDVKVLNVSEASKEDVTGADVVMLGSPSMGSEVIEEGEMEPFVDSIASVSSGKNMILFGSYGWGDGEWMRNWKERMDGYGANVLAEIICQGAPDSDCELQCKEVAKLI